MSGRDAELRFQLATYAKWDLSLVKGEGVHVFDVQGGRYLDFYGGHCVALSGHCHPRVVEAIQKQAGELLFYSNVCYSPVRAKAAEALVGLAPRTLVSVFFSNSGAEANENALKMARVVTGKPVIIACLGSFHGRTLATMRATGIPRYHAALIPDPGGVIHVPFGDIEALHAAYGEDVAGILLEPIQSMAGMVEAPASYFQAARDLATRHGGFLIFDEVQTGLGRTGKWFFGEHVEVAPDIVTLAKGIAGGVPVGATLVDERIVAATKIGDYGSTFGGGPLAMAALLATIEVARDQALPLNAQARERQLRARIEAMTGVKALRGRGLLLGIECQGPAKPVIDLLFARRVLVGGSNDPKVLRLMPPLSLSEAECAEFLAVLEESLAEVGGAA